MNWRSQRGSSSAVFVLLWAVIVICLAMATDLGRIYVVREQLRTAQDAAALAGALQVRYMVEFRFTREVRVVTPCDLTKLKEGEVCHDVVEWFSASDLVLSGPESEIYVNLAKLKAPHCRGDYRCSAQPAVARCWIEPKNGWPAVEALARSTFQQNAQWGAGTAVKSLAVDVRQTTVPKDFAVHVIGKLETGTPMLAVLGVKSLAVQLPVQEGRAVSVRRGKISSPGSGVSSPCQ